MTDMQSLASDTYSFGDCPNTFEPFHQALENQLPRPSVFSSNLFGNGDASLCLCQRWQCILSLLHDVPSHSACESYEGETRLLWHLLLHMLQKQLWYPSSAVAQASKLSDKAHDLQHLHLLCINGSSVEEKLNFLSQHLPYVRFPSCDGCLVHSISMEALREKYTMLVMHVWNTVNMAFKCEIDKDTECGKYGDQDVINKNANIDHVIESKVYKLCHMILFHPMFENHIKEHARHILLQKTGIVDRNKSIHVTSPLVIPFTSDPCKDNLTATPVSDGGIVHLLDEDTLAWRHTWKQVDVEDLSGDFKDKPSLLESSEQFSNVTTSELESSLDIMDSSAFSVNRTSSSSCFLGEHSRDLLHDEEEDSNRRRNFTNFSKAMQRDSDKEGEDKAEIGERINLAGRRMRAATETSPETLFTARSLPVARMYSMSVSWTAEELRRCRNNGGQNRERLPHYCSTSADSHRIHEPHTTEEGGSCGCSIFSSNSLVDINDSSVFDKEDEHRGNDNSKQHPGMKNLQTWLKGLRLHKYTYLFQSMPYERFIAVSDAWLIENGVTVGARRKILTHLEELRKMRKEVRDLRDRLERSIGASYSQWRSPLMSTQIGSAVISHANPVNSSSSHPRYNRSSSTSCCNPWPNNSEKIASTLWPEEPQLLGLGTEVSSLGEFLSGTGSPASTASSLSLGTSSNGYFTTSSSSTINPSVSTYCTNVPPPSEMKRWCNDLRFHLISPNSLDASLNEDLFAVLQLLTNFHLRASDQLSGDQLRSFLETLKWAQRCEGFNKSQLSQCITWHSRVESCIRASSSGHGGSVSSPAVGSGCPPTPTNKSGQTNRNKKTPGIQRALSLSCSSSSYMALSSMNNTSKSQGPNPSGLSRSASWKAKNNHSAVNNVFRGGSTCGSVNRPQGLPPFTCHVQLGGSALNTHLFHSPLMSPSSSVSGISSSPLCSTSVGTTAAGGTCKYSIQAQLWTPDLSPYSHQHHQRNSTGVVSPYSTNTGYTSVCQTSSTRQPVPLICGGGSSGGGSTSLATSLITSPFLNSPVSPGQNSSHSNFPAVSRRSSSGVKNFGDSRLPILDSYLSPVSQLPETAASVLSTFSSVERLNSAPLQVSLSRSDGNHLTNLTTQHQHVDTSPFSLNEGTFISSNEAGFNNETSPSRSQPWTLGDVNCTGSSLWEYRSNSSASGVSNNLFGSLNRTEPIEPRSNVLFSLDESIIDTDETSFDFFSGGLNTCDSYMIDPHNDLDSDLARLALDVSAKGMDETC